MSLPRTSAAAVLRDYHRPVEVWELDVPEPEPNAIIVKVELCTMCGTDVHMAEGDYVGIAAGGSRVPLVLGHEAIGRVVALGKDRRTDALNRPLAEGDLISWAYAWCDRCYWCTIAKQPTLCVNQRAYGWGPADQHPYLTGGYAEYCYVMPVCRVIKVPDELDLAVAASSTCAFRTVVHAFEELGDLRTTDTVVIQGSGPVGLYALAYAIVNGASQTICIGAPADRLEIARRWGADHVVDVTATEPEERRQLVRDLTDGRGADVVVECAGVAAAFEEGFGLLRNGGRFLVVGQADRRKSQINATAFNLRQIHVSGSVSADISHFYRAFEFLRDHGNRFDFGALLGKRYGLGDVNDALAAMKAATEAKPVIVPTAV